MMYLVIGFCLLFLVTLDVVCKVVWSFSFEDGRIVVYIFEVNVGCVFWILLKVVESMGEV